MAAQPQSLSSILARSTIEDPDEVLKSANADLKKDKNDVQAQHAKVVALLKKDEYEEALQFFETSGNALADKAKLERAYALYKLGRLEEAAKAVEGVKSRAAKHVAAQSMYRAELFSRASAIYGELEKQKSLNEDTDLKINRGAVDAQLTWAGQGEHVQKKKPDRQDLEAFETAFNAACGSIARGELSQADVLLKRSRELCRHSEDLSEEDKATELLNISVQQMFVLEKLGKADDARALAEQIELDDLPDISTRKVAQSTLLALQSVSNPFQLHKTFNSTPETVGSDKLFSFQSVLHDSNRYAVDLLASKFDGVERSTSKTIKEHPETKTSSSIVSLSVLNAASQARGATGKAAIKAILPQVEQRPDDAGLVLTLVQQYMSINNPSSAVDVLESFLKRNEQRTELRYNPGLIAILVALYESQGRKTHITQELSKSAMHWRQNSSAPPKPLLLAAGKAMLDVSNGTQSLEASREIFETLNSQYSDDKEVTAGFVASHALTDPTTINSSLNSIPQVSDITSSIDVGSLEDAGIPQSSLSVARKANIANAIGAKKRAASDMKQPSTKRRRLPKSRIPKDFVEGKAVDPDRWLPLRERASYRPKKGKKGKDKDRGTQGGPVKEDTPAPKTESAGVIGGSGGGGGGGGKKKGKGKKK